MAVGECSTLPSVLDVTTSNVTFGTSVNVSCSQFGYRLVGAPTLTCNKSAQWEPTVPTCEWTWEFTTYEKVVLGISVAAVAFLIIILFIITISCCCCHQNKEKPYDTMQAENLGYQPSPGDNEPAVYADSYFAYQDVTNKNDQMSGTVDRPWLGYIPRPKVAGGVNYQ